MKEKQLSENSKAPNLGPATPKIVELFDRALAERKDLKKWIEELSSKSNPTIRDRLCVGLYHHQLSFREPPLPAGVSLTGTRRAIDRQIVHRDPHARRKNRAVCIHVRHADGWYPLQVNFTDPNGLQKFDRQPFCVRVARQRMAAHDKRATHRVLRDQP